MATLVNLKRDLKQATKVFPNSHPERFFKTAPNDYGAGDIFLGLSVSVQRKIIKNYLDLDFKVLAQLLACPEHEFRFSALLILLEQYRQAKKEIYKNTKEEKNTLKKFFNFYLNNLSGVNNWDLVDLSAANILGDFLSRGADNQAYDVLNKLASSSNLWKRRIAIVATFAWLKKGQGSLTIKIAKKLLSDPEDLIQKASGWMLRELGKKVSEEELLNFLDKYKNRMTRLTLSYALERIDSQKRKKYIKI